MADLEREGVSVYPVKDLEIDEEDSQINDGLRVSHYRENSIRKNEMVTYEEMLLSRLVLQCGISPGIFHV